MFLITDLTGQIFVLKEKRRRKCKSVSDSANIKTAAVFSKLYLCQSVQSPRPKNKPCTTMTAGMCRLRHTHTHTLWELLGCLNLTDWGYRDELFIFVRALRTWYTPTNNSVIPTFKSPPKAQRLKASSRDSLWTLDRQHIRPRPKPLGVIKSRRVKVARGQPVILVTITAPCTLH